MQMQSQTTTAVANPGTRQAACLRIVYEAGRVVLQQQCISASSSHRVALIRTASRQCVPASFCTTSRTDDHHAVALHHFAPFIYCCRHLQLH
jgi:hypothetical protein